VPDRGGVFEGREIILGPRAGEFYVVEEGLEEGEMVVTNGNFKLDSDLQIRAKVSMMSPEGGAGAPVHQHGNKSPVKATDTGVVEESKTEVPEKLKLSLDELLITYFEIQKALSKDDSKTASQSANRFNTKLSQIDMSLLKGDVHNHWMKSLKELKSNSEKIAGNDKIGDQRRVFVDLSLTTYNVIKRFGTIGRQSVYWLFCPMAFDNKGAYWLQNSEKAENPYFGASMFSCGNIEETLVTMNDEHEVHDH
jgi:Cu(I)/Ag(I) efflux system membrane fusion protein